jgi:hypothetical protein
VSIFETYNIPDEIVEEEIKEDLEVLEESQVQ